MNEPLEVLSVNANKPLAIVHDRRIVFLNENLVELTGYSPDDVGPDNFLDKIMPHTDPEGMFTPDEEINSSSFSCKLVTLPILKKDRSELWCEIYLSPVGWYGKKAVLLIFRDITGYDHPDPEIAKEYKLRTMGLLSTGIVHDMNNLLASITGFIELTLENHSSSLVKRNNLHQALKATSRARDLTQRILSLGQSCSQRVVLTDMASVVKPLPGLLNASFPKGITVWFSCKNARPIMADPNDMFQLLLNLCINARQAITGTTGKIEILIEEIKAAPHIKIKDNLGRGVLSITVSDNGHGIEKNLMEHIFSPCFTTKKEGVGTGIGLALVKHIVREYEGFISLKSTPGMGSCFKIFFPYPEIAISI